MSSYWLQGAFPRTMAQTMGFQGQDNNAIEVTWVMWEVPDADNDEEWEDGDGPEAA